MGGAIQREDGEVLAFDACELVGYDPQIDVTGHPVDTGRTVSDHAQVQPLAFSMSGMVTRTPFQRPDTTGAIKYTDPDERAREFLKACEGQLLAVLTPKNGAIFNVMLTGYPHEVTNKGSITFEMSFRVVEFPSSETVRLPRPKPKAKPGITEKEDKGKVEKVPIVAGSQEATRAKSGLARLRDTDTVNEVAESDIPIIGQIGAITAPIQ